jgi:hypothetical protein
MGTAEVNGKPVNGRLEGGTYKLEIPDGPTYYASSNASIMQRFMYKRSFKVMQNT